MYKTVISRSQNTSVIYNFAKSVITSLQLLQVITLHIESSSLVTVWFNACSWMRCSYAEEFFNNLYGSRTSLWLFETCLPLLLVSNSRDVQTRLSSSNIFRLEKLIAVQLIKRYFFTETDDALLFSKWTQSGAASHAHDFEIILHLCLCLPSDLFYSYIFWIKFSTHLSSCVLHVQIISSPFLLSS
jgi:hypothetical protein